MLKFEHDIFISYAHIDNESMYGSEHGWIALLHKGLGIRLAQLLGRESRIWRDSRLTHTDPFPPDVLKQLSRAALLVSVLSPRYVNSDWCLRELNEFHKLAVKSAPDTVGNMLRILKTIKTPIELEEHPPVL